MTKILYQIVFLSRSILDKENIGKSEAILLATIYSFLMMIGWLNYNLLDRYI